MFKSGDMVRIVSGYYLDRVGTIVEFDPSVDGGMWIELDNYGVVYFFGNQAQGIEEVKADNTPLPLPG